MCVIFLSLPSLFPLLLPVPHIAIHPSPPVCLNGIADTLSPRQADVGLGKLLRGLLGGLFHHKRDDITLLSDVELSHLLSANVDVCLLSFFLPDCWFATKLTFLFLGIAPRWSLKAPSLPPQGRCRRLQALPDRFVHRRGSQPEWTRTWVAHDCWKRYWRCRWSDRHS